MTLHKIHRLALALAGLALVSSSAVSASPASAAAGSEQPVPGLELSIIPGEHWLRSWTFFILPTKAPAQYAAWVEDLDGEYLGTVSVTASVAEGRWKAAPKEGRPEALPVWSHKKAAAAVGGVDEDHEADAVAGATPLAASTAYRLLAGLRAGERYRAFLEINHSFDYNAAWPKKAKRGEPGWSGVNGQPSIVYAAEFIAGSGEPAAFEPAGRGSVDGADGRLRPGLDGLTTALSIIGAATITSR